MRTGIRTTEFWLTLGQLVVTLLVTAGVIAASDTQQIQGAITNGVTAVFGLFAAGAVIVRYIQSRTELKESENR